MNYLLNYNAINFLDKEARFKVDLFLILLIVNLSLFH